VAIVAVATISPSNDTPRRSQRSPTADSSLGSRERPLVSVLTPSFDQARWLAENLTSVHGQTYEPIEHVVIDGGSTDGSLELLQRSTNPGLTWQSEPDDSQSHALNKALTRSQGSIIGWLNSDDAYFGPTVVEDVVDVFAANPDVGVVYGHAVLVAGDGHLLQVLWAPRFDRNLLRLHDFIWQPAAFMRREILGNRLVDESFHYAMDYELWLRLSQHHQFKRINRIVAVDRHHSARKSYTMMDVGQGDRLRLEDQFDVVGGAAGAIGRKAWKVMARLLGVPTIRSAMTEPVAFPMIRDGVGRLFLRQVAVQRKHMGTGD
jgi:glycosyltransferase involved in cell wall biosynthesis